jgi:hypothetical protein
VLDRALAAIGDDPVLHVTFRSDWGASLVDLATGDVTPLYAEQEAWYDPARGLKQISRLGNTVTGERFYRPGQLYRPMTERFDALATQYREALESGEAKVVADGRVGDRRVHWIRIDSEWHLDSRDAREHLFAEEVAVDAETFEPVYLRSTFDGRSPPGRSYGELITKVETLPEDAVDFGDTPADERPRYYGERFGRGLDRKELERAVPGGALWFGRSLRGLPFADARQLIMTSRIGLKGPKRRTTAVSIFYGGFRLGHRDATKRHVVVQQATSFPRDALVGGRAYEAPDGSVLVQPQPLGLLRRGERSILIRGREMSDVVAAAASLAPFGSAPPPLGFDPDRVTRAIKSRRLIRVEGFAPVRPRPILEPGAKVAQSGSGSGVSVRIYRPGVAVFDTTGIAPRLRKLLPERVSAACVKVPRTLGSIGGVSVPLRRRITVPLLGHYRRGQPPRPVPPPFDACELGTGLGRNWFPRFNWHGGLEIPLTDRGRRWFEQRAAARKRAAAARRR